MLQVSELTVVFNNTTNRPTFTLVPTGDLRVSVSWEDHWFCVLQISGKSPDIVCRRELYPSSAISTIRFTEYR